MANININDERRMYLENYTCPECGFNHIGQLIPVEALHDLITDDVTLENELNVSHIALGFEGFRCLDCLDEFSIDGSCY